MKGVILWTLLVVFIALTMQAVKMGQYETALVMGVIAAGCGVAAPMGSKSKAGARR